MRYVACAMMCAVHRTRCCMRSIDGMLYALCCMRYVVDAVHSTVCCMRYVACGTQYCMLYALCCMRYVVCAMLHAEHSTVLQTTDNIHTTYYILYLGMRYIVARAHVCGPRWSRFVCVCVCVSIWVCACLWVHVCVCVRIHERCACVVYWYACVQYQFHTHTHTHTHSTYVLQYYTSVVHSISCMCGVSTWMS